MEKGDPYRNENWFWGNEKLGDCLSVDKPKTLMDLKHIIDDLVGYVKSAGVEPNQVTTFPIIRLWKKKDESKFHVAVAYSNPKITSGGQKHRPSVDLGIHAAREKLHDIIK